MSLSLLRVPGRLSPILGPCVLNPLWPAAHASSAAVPVQELEIQSIEHNPYGPIYTCALGRAMTVLTRLTKLLLDTTWKLDDAGEGYTDQLAASVAKLPSLR